MLSAKALRQFPESLRPRLQVAYALAWETLVVTHAEQVLRFLGDFASAVPPLEALDFYFEFVAVPPLMQDFVRTRVLTSLDDRQLGAPPARPGASGMERLRELFHVPRRLDEETRRLMGLAGARAEEAVAESHVRNALHIAGLVEGSTDIEEAVAHYLSVFSLPLTTAHLVYQRARARAADRYLAGFPAQRPPVLREPAALMSLGGVPALR